MFENKMFDVEHALSMYATSFVLMPSFGIYDEKALSAFAKNMETCHVYLIGLMPRIDFVEAKEVDGHLFTSFKVAGKLKELSWPMPPGATLMNESGAWYIVTRKGERVFPAEEVMSRRLNEELDAIHFEILYIGQAYGEDGSRNALDRLLKHETLQKISIQGFPTTHRLYLLLLEIQPANTMISVFNPRAENKDQTTERISKGLDKLYGTKDSERITLYEASLIRYFQPKYNKEFKHSFPSTNMKVLADCYDKDFAALTAEICFDKLPLKLFTDTVPPNQHHIVKHDLHDIASRKMFFN